MKANYDGYKVFIGNTDNVILEIWLDHYISPERSQKYISALTLEVDNYINGLTEKPEYFCISALINQSYEGRNKRKFYFTPTGIKVAHCTLISSDETYNDYFIKRIIPIMGKYWLRSDD